MYEGEGMFNENQLETSGKAADDSQQSAEGAASKEKAAGEDTSGKTEGTEPSEEDKKKQEEQQAEDDKLSPEEKQKKIDDAAAAEAEKKRLEEEAADEKLTPEEKQAKIDAKKKEDEKAQAEEQQKATDKIRAEAIADLLKKHNVASEEELEKKLNPPKALSEEEKTQQEEIFNASLAKFAIENKVFKSDELLAFQNMKAMAPEKLVFNEFDKNYRDGYKDRVDADNKPEPVTEEEVKDAFNDLYHVDSDNKVLVEQGKKAIEAQAKAMISPLEQKYNDVKEVFEADQAEKIELPKFKSFLKTTITEAIPAQMEFGEGDDKVVFKFEKVDKEAIEKLFVNNEEFNLFRSGEATEQQKQRIAERVKEYVISKNIKEITKVISDVRYDAGVKKGAVGSQARFDKNEQRNQESVHTSTVTKEEQEQVGKAFANV